MIKKGSKLFSIINNKCPRCNQGDFFINSNPYKTKGLLKIYDHCPSCNLKYMIEPSFYYGAMYVSYGLTVTMAVAIFIICYFLGLGLITSAISIVVVLMLALPNLVRISRLIYINMFVRYEKKFEK